MNCYCSNFTSVNWCLISWYSIYRYFSLSNYLPFMRGIRLYPTNLLLLFDLVCFRSSNIRYMPIQFFCLLTYLLNIDLSFQVYSSSLFYNNLPSLSKL